MSSKVYRNVPLVGETSIRLLSLHPAKHITAPLEATLRMVLLSDEPDYQALSYTWGPPFEEQTLKDQQISIDGKPLTVTGNLFRALQRIRQHDEKRKHGEKQPLWVDAICIDQGNDDEKSRQVGMMADIYHAASEVLVWLGEDSRERDGEYILRLMLPPRHAESSDAELSDIEASDTQISDTQPRDTQVADPKEGRTAKLIGAAKRIFGNRKSETYQYNRSGREPDQRGDINFDQRDDDELDQVVNYGRDYRYNLIDQKLETFTKRRYFRRRWQVALYAPGLSWFSVLQEMHQARQVIFCCGQVRASWGMVYSGVQHVYNEFHYNISNITSPFSPQTRHARGTPIWILDNLEARTSRASKPKQSHLTGDNTTLDILMDCRDFECSDPRDRLYAMANLFSGAHKFPADYSNPLSTVYTNFVRHCLENEPTGTSESDYLPQNSSKALSILLVLAAQQASTRGESTSSEEKLPSWVPDWQQAFEKVAPIFLEPVQMPEIRDQRLMAGLYQCGTFRDRELEHGKRLDFVDINGRFYDDLERFLPLRQPFNPDCQAGDIVCGPLVHHMTSYGSLFALVLRPTSHDSHVHRITGLYAISMDAFDEKDVSRIPRVERRFEIM